MFIGVILLVFTLPFLVSSCGLTTHIEVAQRSQDLWLHQPLYRQYIRQYPGALQAGSLYSDAFYDSTCYNGNFHQVSENAHWFPFMKTAIEYMREKHPPPLQSTDTDGQKLLVFLLGIASHQVADAVWHASLTDCPNGFIDATAWESFNNDVNQAHGSDDTGGDSIVNYELPVGYIGRITKWYVPTNDLIQIHTRYAAAYNSSAEENFNALTINICTGITYFVRFADVQLLGQLYPTYSRNNSFLLEQFHGYYYGSLQEMAQQTIRFWDRMIAMYNQGTDICTLKGINPYYLNCTIPNTITNQQQQQLTLSTSSELLNFLPSADDTLPLLWPLGLSTVQTGLVSNQSYAGFGHATLFGDFNGDGITDLVVSAPDYYIYGCAQGGRVFIIYGRANQPLVPSNQITVIEQRANQTLISPQCDGDRFGTALTRLDWNNDGFDDLVVSSPSHGFGFRGAVFVFAGSAQGLQSQSYLRIDGVNEHDAIGFELHTAHLDNDNKLDLIITSPYAQPNGYSQPQQGAVWIFLSTNPHISNNQLTIADASFTLWGETAKSKFGYSLQIIPSSCSGSVTYPTIMISAPAGQGKLLVYSFEPSPHLIFTLSGTASMGHFGQSFSTYKDNCWLAVGSPTRLTNWYGGVDVLSLSNLFQQSNTNLQLSNVPVLISINGDKIFQRLGTTIHWTPGGNLCISAPLGKLDILPLQLRKSVGRAYIVSRNKIPAQPSSSTYTIKDMNPITYVAANYKMRFGTRTNLLSSSSVSYYVISSPLSTASNNVRLPGMLYIVSV